MKKNKLGLVVATKREALWIRIRDGAKEQIQTLKDQLEFQEEILKLAKHKILLEQRK